MMQPPPLEGNALHATKFGLGSGVMCKSSKWPADLPSCDTSWGGSCPISSTGTKGSSSRISSGSSDMRQSHSHSARLGQPPAGDSDLLSAAENVVAATDINGGTTSAKLSEIHQWLPLRKKRGGELRRRAYRVPDVRLQSSTEGHHDGDSAMLPRSPDNNGIMIQGPLQEHKLLFFWQWRWCVLSRHGELQVYRSKQAAAAATSAANGERRPGPLQRYPLSNLLMSLDPDMPSVLVCVRASDGKLATLLRSGPGIAWEEVAASKLWLRMFLQASQAA